MKIYRIRNKETGLFKCSGIYVYWDQQGGEWSAPSPAKAILTRATEHYERNRLGNKTRIMPECEIVEFEREVKETELRVL